MTRTLIYLVIAAVLGFGVWFFLFRGEQGGFNAQDAGFRIKDTGELGKIFLADRKDATTLTRGANGEWTADGKYRVLPSVIQQLLVTLATQQPQAPVVSIQRDGVIRSLAGYAVKVELYDRKNRPVRTFYVGGEASNYAGTYMMMNGSETPYIVQIPGYGGYVTPRYLPGLKTWRDRAVFNIPDDRIRSVEITYPRDPASSFRAVKTGKDEVDLEWAGMQPGDTLNRERALRYFRFFDRLYAESFVSGGHGIDTILSRMPQFCEVTVETQDGRKTSGAFYYMPLNRSSKNLDAPDRGDGMADFDSDRFYAVMNGGKDTMVAQFATFQAVLRRGGEFYLAGSNVKE